LIDRVEVVGFGTMHQNLQAGAASLCFRVGGVTRHLR
jgi:hypothetical protein